MKRRSFLAALFAAPVIPAAAKLAAEKAAPAVEALPQPSPSPLSDIGTVRAGVIRSLDGRSSIDLNRGVINLFDA